ncbi:restriction endonuclease subunit S [Helicobacter sp. 23-1045]
MQKQTLNLNESLQAKYPHLELSVLSLSQVQKDNESKRIDSEYFKKEYLENEKIIISQTKIKDFLESRIKNIKTLNLNKNFAYLQISDIDTNNGLEYTTTETDFAQIPDRATYILQHNDICVSTVRPNRNAVALIKDSKRLVGTSGFCVLRLKETSEILPEVLYIFCKTKFFITKMMRANTASLYPAVIDSDIFKCQIPKFSQDFQLEIQNLVQDSHKALEDSKALYKEAENLLYESLGLDSHNPLESLFCHTERSEVSKTRESKRQNESMIEKRINKLNSHLKHCDSGDSMSSDLDSSLVSLAQNDNIACKYPHLNISIRTLSQSYGISGRLDSEYYQTKYDAIERKIRGYQGGYFRLQSSEIKDSNFTPKAQEKYRYIELANIGNNGNISEPLEDLGENLPTRARRKVKTGDFIMSSIEGSLASCAIITPEFDNCLVSTGFYVLDSVKLNSETLLVLFKCAFFQEYLRKFSSGTILTAISKDELQNILIPKIATATQEQIASKIQKSFALRAKSKSLLESAKIKVESAIDGGVK